MRITYRYKKNKDYWKGRWENIPVDKPMTNKNVYPLKYSEICINNSREGKILEAGCGDGRILRYYHNQGYKISGFDFIGHSIEKIKKIDPSIDVQVGDITKLTYPKDTFDFVLSFGLYHNLEKKLNEAINETHRVLKKNGKVCASFRADNIQNYISDWLFNRNTKVSGSPKFFHKMNLKKKEFLKLFSNRGFEVEHIYAVENMSFLYKIPFFRNKSQKLFKENDARAKGYNLSFSGNLLQKILMKFFKNQFCNVFVIIAKKI